ncbi:glycosyltransferase [Hydrogenimonas thermophila]|uniref:glycosyltransferase family 2 protein n=1 Tax=Hydrogenimonas thermophila TaxID=223786 RepID=UPI0029371D3B|nr:glycosyltransferase [Hydrogenimonas thermophila]WOE69442.1 glycosyltransferase [Hydrogenimonas thermophila]WOE71952.1 glycosyltransferase [Hydrogenimonas thermophila]
MSAYDSLEKFKKKYLHGIKNKTIFLKRRKRYIKKLKIIPPQFWKVFDEQSYIEINPDIKESIEKGVFESAVEHFIIFGFDEVKNGKRSIGERFPCFNEDIYLKYNRDLQEVKKKFPGFDLFQHFLGFGYKEYLEGQRLAIGFYLFNFNQDLQNKFEKIFDEKSYIEANNDVYEAIEKKLFKDGWEHFKEYGVNEVRVGIRQIHKQIPKFSEIDYLLWFEDVKAGTQKGNLFPFVHFLENGYKELLTKDRTIPGNYVYNEPKISKNIKYKIQKFKKKPLISIIIPVYNVNTKWLDLAIKSVEKQWYDNWELCIVDDASSKKETKEYLKQLKNPKIKVKFLEENQGISAASNNALTMAKGEYVALMDNDDELTPDALYEVVKIINEKDAEFIYSDEDKIEPDGTFSDPHFKPDFAPDMFLSQNYLSHLGIIKKELVEKVGGWEVGLEGSQDYDLYLKVLEHTNKIDHIPKVLYHWRKVQGSTASEFSSKSYAQEAGRKALENAMKRRDIRAIVKNGKYPGTYKIEYELKDEPLISIIIPFKDKPELLKMSIESVLNKSTYNNFEIIGISNNSEEKETFKEMKRLESLDKRVKFYEYNIPFNYSKINNYAVANYAKGEHIVLMNNDIEIITPNWLEEMLMYSQRDDVGVVGAKLYYPDDTIQHAGVILGIGGVAGHSHKYFTKKDVGYFARPHITQNLSALTAALFMVKKRVFEEVKGLDENNLKVAFNDVDFCLKVKEKGYLNVFTPWAEAYHHESKSRGAEDTPEKQERFKKEVEFMQNKWKDILVKGDPYYNPNLTLDREDFSLKGNK